MLQTLRLHGPRRSLSRAAMHRVNGISVLQHDGCRFTSEVRSEHVASVDHSSFVVRRIRRDIVGVTGPQVVAL